MNLVELWIVAQKGATAHNLYTMFILRMGYFQSLCYRWSSKTLAMQVNSMPLHSVSGCRPWRRRVEEREKGPSTRDLMPSFVSLCRHPQPRNILLHFFAGIIANWLSVTPADIPWTLKSRP